jgi:hypothetical protein
VKPVIIRHEAEKEPLDSIAFYEGRQNGLGVEFEGVALVAVLAI